MDLGCALQNQVIHPRPCRRGDNRGHRDLRTSRVDDVECHIPYDFPHSKDDSKMKYGVGTEHKQNLLRWNREGPKS